MAAMSRLLPLAAFSTFAIFLLALLATPTNALANEQYAHAARGHGSIAKRKRNSVKRAKRCRPKSASLPVVASTSASPAYKSSSTDAPVVTSAAYSANQGYSQPAATTKPPKTTTKTSSSAVATTSAAAPVSGSGGGIYGDGKKLAYAWPNGNADLAKWKSNRLAGLYTWSPFIPSDCSKLGINGWQMLWGTKQKADFIAQTKANPSNLMFGMNEPNQHDQSAISPADAAGLWKELMQPFANQGVKLVSPATTSAPDGFTWMQDFIKACDGCTINYIGIHWYDVDTAAFKTYLNKWHDAFGKDLIVSEYACQNFNGGAQCDQDKTWAFHTEMRNFFESTPWIAAYAPFGAMHDMVNVNPLNQLMNGDGSPNALGNMYLTG